MNELYYIQNFTKARFLNRTYLYGHLLFLSTLIFFGQLLQAKETAKIVTSTPSTLTIHTDINPDKLSIYTSENNEVRYYQSLVLAVPNDGDISLAGLQLGNQTAFQNDIPANKTIAEKNIIEFSEPIYVRGQKYVTVYIFPVTFSGVYEDVDFTVSFTGTVNSQKSVTTNSPFEKILKSSVLNYEQSSQFAKTSRQNISTNVTSGPFTQTSNWIKIEVNKNGLYRISGAQLDASGITVTGASSSSLHLYSGGGKQLPVPNEIARPEFKEIAIKVVDGGDNIFNTNDYILFYGESVNRWIYDTSGVSYHSHSYTENNVYWLEATTLSNGLRIASADGSINGAVGGFTDQRFDRFTKRVHIEQNHLLRRWTDNKINDYYTWYWYDNRELSFFASTENIVPNDTVDVQLFGITADTTGSLDDIGGIDFYVNNVKGIDKVCVTSGGCNYRSASFVDGANDIDLFLMYFTISPPYFDFMELAYRSFNQPVQNQLDITLGPASGRTEIEVVNSFSSAPMILDISNPQEPRELVLSSITGSTFSFYDTLSMTKYNRYYLAPPTQSFAPLSITAETTKDLYASSTQTDLFVISPRFMQTALEEFRSYRNSQGYSVQLVSVEDIMDNFSYGLYDPTAIRDFLKNSYETYPAPKPSAVLFVGDANYDYLNNLSTGMPNFVPAFTHQIDNTSSDDNYLFFGDFGLLDSDTTYSVTNRGFDMMSARWPVRTSSDVQTIIGKIKGYESTDDFGSWRDKVTLVADDEYGSLNNEYFHTQQIETLEKNYLPNFYNRNKIYLWEYPIVNGEKPEVNAKIVSAFNEGTLLVNYVGHGNPDVWAHENVFNRAGDLPKLTNVNKLPLVIAASCAIGFYDDPLREGMAEELLAMPSGGAIGVISATRLVYSGENSEFNRKLYEVIFNDKSLSVCEALYTAKIEKQYEGGVPQPKVNDRNYLLFGGPFVKLAQPEYDIEFTTKPDSFVALGQTVVAGRVLDGNGLQIQENGIVEINVLDSKRNKRYATVDYSVNGPTIYRGSATVTNGQFNFQFVPPLDIGFGGDGAQVYVYAAFESADASGIIDSISISDSISVSADSIGPEIKVAFSNHQDFVSGDLINQGETMMVELSDQSGINLAGGLGHGITLEFDNQSEKLQNLSTYFSYNQDSFNRGSLQFPIEQLADGVHSFKIKAWDNANNFSKVEFDVEVKTSTKLEIVNLLNYPNPMRQSTRFSFNLTQPVNNFELSIFTLSGKKIKTFSRGYLEPSYFDDIVWYGEDVDGDRVATEVYIYKATAYPTDGSEKVESFGKIILVN